MNKLDKFISNYSTPKAFKTFVTIFILVSLWAIFCIYPFRFYTEYVVHSVTGEVIHVSTNEGLDTAPGTYFSGNKFIYDNGNKSILGVEPHLTHIWEIFSYNFGFDFGPIISIILKILCLGSAIVGLAFIWMNRPKFSFCPIGVFLVTLLLAQLRIYDYEEYWTPGDGYIAVSQTKFSQGILWIPVVLLLVFTVLAVLTTRKGDPRPKPVTVVNNSNNPVPVYTPVPNADLTEELRNYKKLLDDGVITQEEFDAKKKQLLGL